jgi:nitroimidazol reductase NimA-like FMN-containing flavoprotein (pyridoxamine 5'-phosphate oxidase superfamily)
MMREDLDGLQILDEQQCRLLVQRVRVGRIALTHRAMPLILPVTFGFADPDLIISVGAGVLAEAAEQSQIVCLQAEGYADGMTSWSVSVIGRLAPMVAERDIVMAEQLGITPWSTAGQQHFARLTPEVTTGRARGILL